MVKQTSDRKATIRLTPQDCKILGALSKKLSPRWEPRKPTTTDVFRVALRELATKEGVTA